MPQPRHPIVPDDFVVPDGLDTEHFVLRPLRPEHNESDHAAWTSSIDHIRATPGVPDGNWPSPMSLEDNLADLERHTRDYHERIGFTYTVLDPADQDRVIGCVYIYGRPDSGDVEVQSWVTQARADLDPALRRATREWLDADWPFDSIVYEG